VSFCATFHECSSVLVLATLADGFHSFDGILEGGSVGHDHYYFPDNDTITREETKRLSLKLIFISERAEFI
jgi:hypothetical protein